ncbi:DNA-binding NarL/FixJ family response regulator [Kineococcus radiotolerans]|uniref:DNA-binding NarL/FixJ family response regulator n=1 Tax=Kineococcus radiotolerans TaxID=131568 RepID=A0A7W4TJC7_KINRA|nr:response regulator transcription factor [Kineococcus radiotolerans]MBB2899984.1 DNA-binding NarL/FixJ family response regulator [Kineococcus radiotolerans]
MTGRPVRVVLVDDDPLVRVGLGLALGGAPQLEVVGEAVDGAHALEVVERLHPDVVLMDVRMPRMDGLEATERLRRLPDPPQVLVLTTFDADEHVLRALAVGAAGFLLKDTSPPDIVAAVERVAAGEPALSPSVTTGLIRRVVREATEASAGTRRTDVAAARLAVLSEREREVALAVAQGKANAEIAAELYMSVATVKAHVSHVLAKLGLANRVQIALCVHDAGLV